MEPRGSFKETRQPREGDELDVVVERVLERKSPVAAPKLLARPRITAHLRDSRISTVCESCARKRQE